LIKVRTPSPFWFPAVAGESTISSEDRVAWNFKVPGAGESLGETPDRTNWRKERNRVQHDRMRRGHLSSIEECRGNSDG